MGRQVATRRVGMLLAFLVLALPRLAGAAEAEAGSGMPQLRFSDPALIAQVVWMLLIFGALYFIMHAYALPRVASVLQDRQARIRSDLESAHATQTEANATLAALQEASAKARAEAQAAVADAVKAAQSEAQARSEVLAARLSKQIDAAEQRIGSARDAAMGALRQVSTDTAEALLVRLTGDAQPQAVGEAVDRALAARGQG